MYIQVLEYTLDNTPLHEHGDLMARDIEFYANKLKTNLKKPQSARDLLIMMKNILVIYISLLRNEIKALATALHLCAWDWDTVSL